MIEFIVDDMINHLCAGIITDAIKTVDQDAVVEVDFAEHLVRVDSTVPSEDIEAAIREQGYSPHAVLSEQRILGNC